MSSLKQLAARVPCQDTTVLSHAFAVANFAGTSTPPGKAGEGQPRNTQDKHNTATAPNGGFAGESGAAARGHWPRLTICRDFGLGTVSAVLRRSLFPRSRILLCLNRFPADLRAVHRLVLAGVDAVLVESDAVARAIRESGAPAPRIILFSDPGDLALFNQPPRSRASNGAYRILHVGDLEPEAGVADFLPCVVAWADRNPDREVEIWWSGEGCLQGVLEAQPLPANVLQQFPGKVSREKLALMFLECDMLAVPALSNPWTDVISEAVTAQLPVLGSSRSRTVVELVTHGVTGWIFDPFEAGAMARAVDLALNTSPHELEQMRVCAAGRSQPLLLPGLDERIRRAMRLGASEPPFDFTSLGFAP